MRDRDRQIEVETKSETETETEGEREREKFPNKKINLQTCNLNQIKIKTLYHNSISDFFLYIFGSIDKIVSETSIQAYHKPKTYTINYK